MTRLPLRVDLPDTTATDFPDAAEQYVLRMRRHYDFRARWHARCYRFSGVVVIIAGAALPMLVSLDYPGKNTVVSLTGVLIAAITALRVFYRWDQSWILLRKTENSITTAWWDYQSALRADGVDRRERVAALVQRVVDIRREEAESFFQDLGFPARSGMDGGIGTP
jgi:uncharacterized protein DUF4231